LLVKNWNFPRQFSCDTLRGFCIFLAKNVAFRNLLNISVFLSNQSFNECYLAYPPQLRSTVYLNSMLSAAEIWVKRQFPFSLNIYTYAILFIWTQLVYMDGCFPIVEMLNYRWFLFITLSLFYIYINFRSKEKAIVSLYCATS